MPHATKALADLGIKCITAKSRAPYLSRAYLIGTSSYCYIHRSGIAHPIISLTSFNSSPSSSKPVTRAPIRPLFTDLYILSGGVVWPLIPFVESWGGLDLLLLPAKFSNAVSADIASVSYFRRAVVIW